MKSVDDANNKVTVSITDDKLKNLQESMLCQAGGEITIGNVKYLYTDWSFDEAAGTYTFQLSNDTARSPRITAGMKGKSVRTSEKVAYQGIPYYMQQMNTWIRGFADKVKKFLTQEPMLTETVEQPIREYPFYCRYGERKAVFTG